MFKNVPGFLMGNFKKRAQTIIVSNFITIEIYDP